MSSLDFKLQFSGWLDLIYFTIEPIEAFYDEIKIMKSPDEIVNSLQELHAAICGLLEDLDQTTRIVGSQSNIKTKRD